MLTYSAVKPNHTYGHLAVDDQGNFEDAAFVDGLLKIALRSQGFLTAQDEDITLGWLDDCRVNATDNVTKQAVFLTLVDQYYLPAPTEGLPANKPSIFVIHELDEFREATGIVAAFCSQVCMDQAPKRFESEAREEDETGGLCPGCRCETCGTELP